MTCSWDTHSLRTTARHEEKPFALWGKDWISNFWFLLMKLHKIHSLYHELEKVIKKIKKVILIDFNFNPIYLPFCHHSQTGQSILSVILARTPSSAHHLPVNYPASFIVFFGWLQGPSLIISTCVPRLSVLLWGSLGVHPPVWSEGSTIGRRVLTLSEPVPFHSGCLLPSLCPLASQMAFPLSQRLQSSLRTSWMTLAPSMLPLMNPRGYCAVNLPSTMTEPGEAKDAFMRVCVPSVPTVCPCWPKRLPPFVGSLTREFF